jgi:hypothetical protein
VTADALANVVAALHIAYFLFVVGGSIWIVAGARQRWPWVYNPWFRIGHLLAVLLVLAEDVFHFPCLLNVLERDLRSGARPSGVGGVLDVLLRHTIPGWFLDSMYWTLGVALTLLVLILPPRFRRMSA